MQPAGRSATEPSPSRPVGRRLEALASATAKCVAAIESSDAKKASVFVSEKLVVSVCRRFKRHARSSREDFVLKIGAPNYLERKFIRLCRRAGEPLPVKKVQLRPWPRKRG